MDHKQNDNICSCDFGISPTSCFSDLVVILHEYDSMKFSEIDNLTSLLFSPLISKKYLMYQKIADTTINTIGRDTKMMSLANTKGSPFSPVLSSFLESMKQSSDINLVPISAAGTMLPSNVSMLLGQLNSKDTQIAIIWIWFKSTLSSTFSLNLLLESEIRVT